MVSGHPLKPLQYVKIFTYQPDLQTSDHHEREELHTF